MIESSTILLTRLTSKELTEIEQYRRATQRKMVILNTIWTSKPGSEGYELFGKISYKSQHFK